MRAPLMRDREAEARGSRARRGHTMTAASSWSCRRWAATGLLLAVAIRPAVAQPGGDLHYAYDDLNRLIAVVNASGDVSTYEYDAVGNLLAIRRVNAAEFPGAVAITLVSPNAGRPGTAVSIFGKGFSPTPAQNIMSFNGAPGLVSAATATMIATSVPEGATTGPITVTTSLGTATSATPFQVIGTITLSPPGAVVLVGTTRQFRATESGNPAPTLTWSVNGIAGGSAATGTITPAGLYTAPPTVPSPAEVRVAAADTAFPTAPGSAQALIVGAALGVSLATPVVSVQVTAPPAPPPSATVTAPGVSLQVPAAPAPASATLVAPMVAVTLAPVVTAVSPSAATPSDFTLTVGGIGFSGATGLSFLLNNAVDGAVSASDLVVSADGTQATARISVAPSAAEGDRIVQITTPQGSSTAAGTGGNRFTVE